MMSKNVVITGGSNGFGRAMTYEFYKRNNKVLVAGRNVQNLKDASNYILRKYESEMENGKGGKSGGGAGGGGAVFTFPCDVRDYKQVHKLGRYAEYIFEGNVHHWINNAAMCEGPVKFEDLDLDDLCNVISTNMLGTVYGFKVAQDIQAENVYAVSGHGSDGGKTADFAMYGASKAAVSQLVLSLTDEFSKHGSNLNKMNVRVIAPGIMKTDLSKKLLESGNMKGLQAHVFNMLCADPAKVAAKVVPQILSAKGTGNVIRGF